MLCYNKNRKNVQNEKWALEEKYVELLDIQEVKQKQKEVILSGLEKLEYQGYDSSGIAIVLDNQQLFINEEKGKLAVLKEYMEKTT